MSRRQQILEGLNAPQAEAVQTVDGPVMIFAGAGSGKTRVLVHRIAWLIEEAAVPAESIMAVTFTNKAAKEMRERCADFIGPAARNLWVSTFHSSCNRILRAHATELDFDPSFSILDVQDQKTVIKDVLQDLEIDTDKHKPKAVLNQIEKAKQKYQSPESFRNQVTFTGLPFGEVYAAYQYRLQALNSLDFGDLLYHTIRLFEEKPDILQRYHNQLRYLMIDEYQDTNMIQYRWIKLLSEAHGNLCVVGDDDQSIYSWRGADMNNIRHFQRDYKGAKIIKLEQNYRSTATILEAAWEVIRKNRARTEKRLWTEGEKGDPILIRGCGNESDEARHTIQWLLKDTDPHQYRQRAVFYRTNAQSRSLEEECIRQRVPYRVYGGVSFYSRKEIKDVLAYLRLLVNPRDFPALERTINTPRRGIGKATVDKLRDVSRSHGGHTDAALQAAATGGLVGKAVAKKVAGFLEILDACRTQAETLGIVELTRFVLERTAYVTALQDENTEEAKDRIENLDELLNAMAGFEEGSDDRSLDAYLQSVSLLSDLDQEDTEDAVTLMTMHMAKGLEFDRVAIVGLEEDLFPSARSLAEDPVNGIEEERRLCYVGLTRARKHLALFYTQTRRVWGVPRASIPSRFIREVPPLLVHNITPDSSQLLGDSGGASRSQYRPQAAPNYEKRQGSPATYSSGPRTVTRKAAPLAGPEELDGWTKGSKVKHPTLGVGIIRALEPSGGGPKLHIRFRAGDKIILPKYVRLEKI